ncbi:glycosyltransferase family 61 protein [Chroogloeocystis siderophila]|uniref:glycosyltransferase family 61 protein n=1 Tax=Chroogloeocystis siderophila TaxID=329163 RepID=UPI001C49FB7F|nr:glycosyltransferase family 61 protein [Chroogloeocystis siderophila]
MIIFISFQTQIDKFTNRLRMLYRVQLKSWLRKPFFYFCKKLGLTTITRETLVNNAEQYRLLHFKCEELVIANEPKTLEKVVDIKNRIHPFVIKIESPFVCEINNTYLAGPAAVGFDVNQNIILETTTPYHCQENHLEGSVAIRALALKSLLADNTPQIDTAFSLINAWSQNYWHWIIDCLTRLEGIEFYQQQTGIKPKLIIDANPTSWQIDSLRLLGYQPQDCIRWNKSRLRVEKLIISSFRRHYDEVYSVESPLASRWIRKRMLSNLSQTENKHFSSKIFISRRQAEGRRIINENDVIATLANFGFVAYILEDMNFEDEVRLFSQATMVVAPHGAGLTNIIFAQNLTLIELFGVSISPCFANLARGLGFQYGYLQCHSPYTALRYHDSDMVVDTTQLKRLLVQMLASS